MVTFWNYSFLSYLIITWALGRLVTLNRIILSKAHWLSWPWGEFLSSTGTYSQRLDWSWLARVCWKAKCQTLTAKEAHARRVLYAIMRHPLVLPLAPASRALVGNVTWNNGRKKSDLVEDMQSPGIFTMNLHCVTEFPPPKPGGWLVHDVETESSSGKRNWASTRGAALRRRGWGVAFVSPLFFPVMGWNLSLGTQSSAPPYIVLGKPIKASVPINPLIITSGFQFNLCLLPPSSCRRDCV